MNRILRSCTRYFWCVTGAGSRAASFLCTASLALHSASAATPSPSSNPVVDWNQFLLQMVRTPGIQPATIHPTRSFAIMHAAIFDAINSIHPIHNPFVVDDESGHDQASEEAATAAAAHEVLIKLYPAAQAQLDSHLQEALAKIPDTPAKEQGLQLGTMIADRILMQRDTDGASAPPVVYVYGTAPGEYQSPPPTSPPQPQFTHWGKVTPFALGSADQFRPGPPPALTNHLYSAAYNEIKAIGVTNSTSATSDEATIGRFWNGAIQNYWNEIAQSAALKQRLSILQSARLFALLNLTLADTVIAFYDAKYTYRFWRPITAIRAGDSDNNPDTAPEPEWLPEVGRTAPDPSYPGAHGAISAAAAQVLALFFHKDRMELTVTSESLPGAARIFGSFSATAKEASLSRVYAGQHFRFDQEAGEELGQAVAQYVVEHDLIPRRATGAYIQHNLISDLAGKADSTDPKLVNPWGIAAGPESPFWIADNHTGLSTIDTGDGGALFAVQIPGAKGPTNGSPTGVVFNDTTNLIAGTDQPARFVFAGEDGTVSAWGRGTNALLVADNSSGNAVYKGLAVAKIGERTYFYAPDFHNGRVDMFDDQFKLVSAAGAFVDTNLPAQFAPFNVTAVGTNLFVSYALPDDDREDDVPGPGNGYVNEFDPSGHWIRRLIARGPLNSPWGMIQAPKSFGELGGSLLIGNFGDGRINAFDFDTGAFLGAVSGPDAAPISVEGLWGIAFGNGAASGHSDTLYFTAGISGGSALEDHGLFGSIAPTPSPLLSIAVDGQHRTELSWEGGTDPFLVQSATDLSVGNWADFLTTTNRSVTVPTGQSAAFYRVVRP